MFKVDGPPSKGARHQKEVKFSMGRDKFLQFAKDMNDAAELMNNLKNV